MRFGTGFAAILAASTAVAAASAGPADETTADQQTLSDDIPVSLQKFTECMVRTASTAPSVALATRGVLTQEGKAFVVVRVTYLGADGYSYLATFGRGRDEPPSKQFMFTNWISGLSPACNVGPDGKPDCTSPHKWEAERHARGPVDAFAPRAVVVAWQSICGVSVLELMS